MHARMIRTFAYHYDIIVGICFTMNNILRTASSRLGSEFNVVRKDDISA